MKKLLLILTPIFILSVFILFYLLKNPQKIQETNKTPTKSAQVKQEAPKIPTPTIQSIFSDKKPDLSGLDQSKIIKLIATGDVIPARGANWPAVQSGNFHYNWEKTASYLKTGDITLINLESPLLKNCPLQTSGFQFCGDARHIQGLTFSGVNAVNIMNNHIGNYAQAGINETIELLETNNIVWSGFSHLGTLEVKGLKFGFLGYNGVGVKIDRAPLSEEIKTAKTKVDILIVSVHWGEEYVLVPDSDGNIAPDNPIEIGHLMIDSGADLVIGNHPHWVQGVEFYKGKLITYAHGNFIFDQTWSQETQEGVVGEYTFYNDKLIDVKYKPIVVDKTYQPVFAEGERAEKILKQMYDSTQGITKLTTKDSLTGKQTL